MESKVNNFVQSYLGRVTMDDPSRLTTEDLKYGEGWSLTNDEREQAVALLKERGAEFKIMLPEEETVLVARVLQELNRWCIQLARNEKTTYHAPLSVDPSKVRLGSALGSACSTVLWVSNHMTIHQTMQNQVDFLVRIADLSGLRPGTLNALSVIDYHRKPNFWDESQEAEAQAAVAFVMGKSDIPPAIAGTMLRLPNLWKIYAQDLSFFRKSKRIKTITVKNLRPGWTPELILAGKCVFDLCRYFTLRGTLNKHEAPVYAVYRAFLDRRGVWAELEHYMTNKEDAFRIPPVGEKDAN